jgi:hypothetical protein
MNHDLLLCGYEDNHVTVTAAFIVCWLYGSAVSFGSESLVCGLYDAAMYGFPNISSLDTMLQPLGSCYCTC